MKKRKLLNYCGLATALIILLASCEKNDGEIILSSTDMAELSSVTNQSLDITFETTTTWKARCTANWLTFSPKSGEAGRNTITISTTSTNRTKSKRTAHLTIESNMPSSMPMNCISLLTAQLSRWASKRIWKATSYCSMRPSVWTNG